MSYALCCESGHMKQENAMDLGVIVQLSVWIMNRLRLLAAHNGIKRNGDRIKSKGRFTSKVEIADTPIDDKMA